MSIPSSNSAGVRQVIRGLRGAGYELIRVAWADQSEDENGDVKTEKEAMKLIFNLDDSYLIVASPDGEKGWVRFVLNPDPLDVICDYTMNLAPTIESVTKDWD